MNLKEMIELLPLHTRPRMSDAYAKGYLYGPNETQRTLLHTFSEERLQSMIEFAEDNIGNKVHAVFYKDSGLADNHYGGNTPIREITITQIHGGTNPHLYYKVDTNDYEHEVYLRQVILGDLRDVKASFIIEREISRQAQLRYINNKYGVL